MAVTFFVLLFGVSFCTFVLYDSYRMIKEVKSNG